MEEVIGSYQRALGSEKEKVSHQMIAIEGLISQIREVKLKFEPNSTKVED